MLHAPCGNHTATSGSKKSHHRFKEKALSHHKNNDNQAHTKGCTEVGKRDILVFLEVRAESFVLRQRNDCGIIRQESHDRSQRSHARQIKQRPHQRTENHFQQVDNAELYEQLTDSTRQNADTHQVEHRIEQQVMCRVHDGVEHVSHAHLITNKTKKCRYHQQTDNTGQSLLKRTFHGL